MHKTGLFFSLLAGFVSTIQAQPAPKPAGQTTPKNIILMVGDGMGTAQIFAGLTGNKGQLNLSRCTAIGFQKTQSADNFVTDSGAGATAFAIGKKAKNGAIGVDAAEKPHPTILEIAKTNGLGTGLVVTCSITHATPACFYAHVPSRSQNEDIARQLLTSDVDVFVGGGQKYFNARADGKNLVDAFKAKGYQVADSTADISQFKTGKLAVFTANGEPRPLSEGRGDVLLNGTTTALHLLSQNKKGFFMMIEGSQIDWGGHANQTSYIVSEMLDFNKTIGTVLDFAEKDGNTLVVITADHETGGLAITDGDMQAGQAEGKYVTKGHTGIMVPVFAYGPGAEAFIGIYENTAIFDKMLAASTWKAQKDTLVYSPRRALNLQGASNFRDLGGYPTQDGHHVKWGHLYRSADISKLTDADLQTLADRHITAVCDLRGPDEIKTAPDRLPAGATWYNMPAGSENTRAATAGLMGAQRANRDSMMLSFYRRTDHLKAKYKPVFDQLLALKGDKALLFHCTAGKDRTGVGAALILSALGVDRATILNDYTATNDFWQGNRADVVQNMVKAGMDEKTVKSMLSANPAYLQATFDAIDRQYGSMDNFLAQQMELTPKKRASLRTKYVD